MKKLFALILCISLILCGCAATPKNNATLPSSFTTVAKVDFDDTEYCLNLTRYADSNWVAEFTAPETVCGLIFTVEGEETDISFKGLHFTFDTQKFPVGSVVSILTKSYDRLAPISMDMVLGETADFATGEVDGMSYTLTADKNGVPTKLDLGDSGMSVKFEEFEISEVTE